MSRKQRKKKTSQPKIENNIPQEFSPETEALYKKILRAMSWVVGVCFVLIIVLPLFENATLDKITTWLFYIGVLTLLSFTFLEFTSTTLKKIIQKHFTTV
jgi:pheromone shutdown protein TraB